MTTYYSLNKEGKSEKSAKLAHASVFLWQDGWDKNKLFAQASRQILLDLAKKTNTMVLDIKKDFIYSNGGINFRFSRRVAEQCSVYVRQAFLSRRFENAVPGLSKRWIAKKQKLIAKFKTVASKPEHIGVLYGNMAKAITYFRTNMRAEGETKHTGYVVGIRLNEYSQDPVEGEDRRKYAKFFLRSDRQTKNRKKSTTKKVSLHSKLSWLEYGSSRKKGAGQKPRPIYSIAVKAYLEEAGFIVPGGPTEVTKKGTHKSTLKKGGKAERDLNEDVRKTLLKSRWNNRYGLKIVKK